MFEPITAYDTANGQIHSEHIYIYAVILPGAAGIIFFYVFRGTYIYIYIYVQVYSILIYKYLQAYTFLLMYLNMINKKRRYK